jgi:hypothetical protein
MKGDEVIMTVIKLPKWTEKIPNKNEMYADFWIGTSLIKMQEYNKKSEVYTARYSMSFKEFEDKVLSSKKESIREWDDYVIWKGIEEARSLWSARYKELRKCAI